MSCYLLKRGGDFCFSDVVCPVCELKLFQKRQCDKKINRGRGQHATYKAYTVTALWVCKKVKDTGQLLVLSSGLCSKVR